jgi:leucyl/phenylalanyl-tRNA--protein transferase
MFSTDILTPYSESEFFPDVENADEYGLLCLGGRLEPAWLIDAFVHGIFPWPFQGRFHRSVLGWFSVDPRGIFELEKFHVSRRLARTFRSGRFRVTADTNFHAVISGSADAHQAEGVWITPEIINAYTELFRLGIGHSIEVWNENRLAGGVYGIGIRGFFAAESMFHLERDASKIALLVLVNHLKKQGYKLFDIQMITPHTASLGATEISRSQYLRQLHNALQISVQFGKIESENLSNTTK